MARKKSEAPSTVDTSTVENVDQPQADPIQEPAADQLSPDPDGWDGYADPDTATPAVDRKPQPPQFDWSSFLDEQNPDDLPGKNNYQPRLDPAVVDTGSKSYSKKDNLINRERTEITQKYDPDKNEYKTTIDQKRKRTRFGFPIDG